MSDETESTTDTHGAAISSFVGTVKALVNAEREIAALKRQLVVDVGLMRGERDRARDVAVNLEEETNRLGGLLLLNAIYPERQNVPEGTPRWDEDPVVLRFGWTEARCGRCGEDLP